jgi:hypothetical protein
MPGGWHRKQITEKGEVESSRLMGWQRLSDLGFEQESALLGILKLCADSVNEQVRHRNF